MKTRKFCPHCGRMLRKSRMKGCAFECRYCGEDFYRFEILRWKKDIRKIRDLRRNNRIHIRNKWWYSADFLTMEMISGYRQSEFNPEDGYQAFVDACDGWWEALSVSEQKEFYKQYH